MSQLTLLVDDELCFDTKFVPMTCLYCAKPPCADVCSTGAIKKREDGIVVIEEDLCTV